MPSSVKKILVAQPKPAVFEKSPFFELKDKYNIEFDFSPLLKFESVTSKDFRSQRVDILAHTAVVFTSRTIIDSFFEICKACRITIPDTMKYICSTEAIALYLQRYIVYRKRKISFGDGSFNTLVELIVKQKDEKIILALSEPHKQDLPDAMHKLAIPFTPLILTRSVSTGISSQVLCDYDMLLLYTPWDVKEVCDKVDINNMPVIATFGDGTLKAAVDQKVSVKVSAPTPEAPSMAKAVDLYISKIRDGKDVEAIDMVDETQKEEFIKAQQSKLARKTRSKK